MIVNGERQLHIEIADRAFQYGDGCFTTMAYRYGQLEFFKAHITRLKLACQRLFITFDKWSELERCILDSLNPNTDCVVKVMITRGEGGRGYSPEGASNPSFVITHHTIPSHYTLWQTKGVKLTLSPIKLACQPLLAGIKHLNRLEQVLVKQALANTGYDDAVVCDTQYKIIETSVGNLFWYKDNHWYTADLTESGVDGVMRNYVEAILLRQGLECRVVKHDFNTLLTADELFICNSLMVIVPVVSLINPITHEIKMFTDGHTKKLQHDVQQVIYLEATKVK